MVLLATLLGQEMLISVPSKLGKSTISVRTIAQQPFHQATHKNRSTAYENGMKVPGVKHLRRIHIDQRTESPKMCKSFAVGLWEHQLQ